MRHRDIGVPGQPGEPTPDLVFQHVQYDHIDERMPWYLWVGRTVKSRPHQVCLILALQHR